MTRKLDAEIAVPAQCELAEGPVWDAARGLLRWVDILRGQVHALDVISGVHSSFGTGQALGTAGLTRDGGLVLALPADTRRTAASTRWSACRSRRSPRPRSAART